MKMIKFVFALIFSFTIATTAIYAQNVSSFTHQTQSQDKVPDSMMDCDMNAGPVKYQQCLDAVTKKYIQQGQERHAQFKAEMNQKIQSQLSGSGAVTTPADGSQAKPEDLIGTQDTSGCDCYDMKNPANTDNANFLLVKGKRTVRFQPPCNCKKPQTPDQSNANVNLDSLIGSYPDESSAAVNTTTRTQKTPQPENQWYNTAKSKQTATQKPITSTDSSSSQTTTNTSADNQSPMNHASRTSTVINSNFNPSDNQTKNQNNNENNNKKPPVFHISYN